jgi:hypothetical protein
MAWLRGAVFMRVRPPYPNSPDTRLFADPDFDGDPVFVKQIDSDD